MRFIKLGIISIIIFFLLITGFSLFIPSTVRISRATSIAASKDAIMNQIAKPENWRNWYPTTDSLQFAYVNGEVRGIMIDSLCALLAEQAFDSLVTGIRSGTNCREMKTGWAVMPGTVPGQQTVQWWMDFRLKWYPWEKFSSLLFEKQYGTQIEKGLSQLKKFVENN